MGESLKQSTEKHSEASEGESQNSGIKLKVKIQGRNCIKYGNLMKYTEFTEKEVWVKVCRQSTEKHSEASVVKV